MTISCCIFPKQTCSAVQAALSNVLHDQRWLQVHPAQMHCFMWALEDQCKASSKVTKKLEDKVNKWRQQLWSWVLHRDCSWSLTKLPEGRNLQMWQSGGSTCFACSKNVLLDVRWWQQNDGMCLCVTRITSSMKDMTDYVWLTHERVPQRYENRLINSPGHSERCSHKASFAWQSAKETSFVNIALIAKQVSMSLSWQSKALCAVQSVIQIRSIHHIFNQSGKLGPWKACNILGCSSLIFKGKYSMSAWAVQPFSWKS